MQVGDRVGTEAGKMGRSLILSLICPTSLDFTLRVKVFKRGSSMIVLFIPRCWWGGWTIRDQRWRSLLLPMWEIIIHMAVEVEMERPGCGERFWGWVSARTWLMDRDTSGLMHRDYADWFIWAGPRGLLRVLMHFRKGHSYEPIYLLAVGLGLACPAVLCGPG